MKRQILCLLLGLALTFLCGCASGEGSELAGEEERPVSPEETAIPAAVLLPPAEETLVPTPEPLPPEPGREELVRVRDYIPDIAVDLRYAGMENFTGKVLYDFSEAWLRYGTVKKLQTAQVKLREAGYGLLIWDAYRPAEAQFRLWEAAPDPVYVANPHTGHSTHSNGGTVDICLVTPDGRPVEMPSGFDEFSPLADRDYRDVSPTAAENARLLENAMEAAGFTPYSGEWWHYADSDDYGYEDLEGIVLPREGMLYTPDCQQYISLRSAPDYAAPILARIPVGEQFPVLGFVGEFARVSAQGKTGYIARAYMKIAE